MARYKILYWQEIPSQVFAADDYDEVNVPLPQQFFDRIDAAALERGLSDTDNYLDQWNWGDELERVGTADVVAQAIAAELASQVDV